MAWIRENYGVPCKRGGRVRYSGAGLPRLGTITKTCLGRLRILLDGDRRSGIYHPTWKIEYLPPNTVIS